MLQEKRGPNQVDWEARPQVWFTIDKPQTSVAKRSTSNWWEPYFSIATSESQRKCYATFSSPAWRWLNIRMSDVKDRSLMLELTLVLSAVTSKEGLKFENKTSLKFKSVFASNYAGYIIFASLFFRQKAVNLVLISWFWYKEVLYNLGKRARGTTIQRFISHSLHCNHLEVNYFLPNNPYSNYVSL